MPGSNSAAPFTPKAVCTAAVAQQTVMRRSKTILIPLALMLAATILLSCSSRRGGKPAISIAVLGYDNLLVGLEAKLAITNIGYMAINFGDALLHTESPSGSRRNYADARMLSMSTDALVGPGSNTLATVLLPKDTLRWQVRYTVRAVDLASRRRHEQLLSERGLPEKEGLEQTVWSQVFECPLTLPEMTIQIGQ